MLCFAMLALLPACKPTDSQKRLSALEQSVAKIQGQQKRSQALMRKLELRQQVFKHALLRNVRKQENDRSLIANLRNDLEYDGGKLEDISFVVKRMIDPIQKLQVTFTDMKVKLYHLSQKQNEIAVQMPGIAAALMPVQPKGPAASPTPSSLDLKKYKKVMEGVG